jgi:hypothetical protein
MGFVSRASYLNTPPLDSCLRASAPRWPAADESVGRPRHRPGTSANSNAVPTLDTPFAYLDAEALRQKMNELLLAMRR